MKSYNSAIIAIFSNPLKLKSKNYLFTYFGLLFFNQTNFDQNYIQSDNFNNNICNKNKIMHLIERFFNSNLT